MRKPNVLCVGFAKCGTTTFYEIMKQHKDIYVPSIKEPPYFLESKLSNKSFDWYLNRFYDKEITQKVIMEINNSFTFLGKDFVTKIKELYGCDTKIIMILRNPIKKAISFYKYYLKVGAHDFIKIYEWGENITENFTNFIRSNKYYLAKEIDAPSNAISGIISDGRYFDRVNEFMIHFGKTNVKCIFFEDFIENPSITCKEIFDFLDINYDDKINYYLKANESNKINYGKWSVYINDFYYRRIYISFMIKYLPFCSYKFNQYIEATHSYVIDKLSKKNEDDIILDDFTYKYLQKYFYDDVRKIENILNRDLYNLWGI